MAAGKRNGGFEIREPPESLKLIRSARLALRLLPPEPVFDLQTVKCHGPRSDLEGLRELTVPLHPPDRGLGQVEHPGDLVVPYESASFVRTLHAKNLLWHELGDCQVDCLD